MLLTVLLYSPVIFIGSGWNSLINNPFVKPLSWGEFLDRYLDETWAIHSIICTWTYRLFLQIILGMGVFLSLIFHFKDAKVKIPLQIVSAVWSLMVMIVMRRFMDRVFLFFVPLWLILGPAPVYWRLFAYLKQPWKKVGIPNSICWSGANGILVSSNGVHHYFPGWQNDPGKVEIVSNYLERKP